MKIIRRKHERGSQVIEMALVLPFVLVLAVMVTSGAGMIRAHQVLNNAAREGTRLSSLEQNRLPGANCATDPDCQCDDTCMMSGLKQAVVTYANANGIPDLTTDTVTVEQGCQVPVDGTEVSGCALTCPTTSCMTASRVTVSYEYNIQILSSVLALLGPKPSGTVTLSAESMFRNMY